MSIERIYTINSDTHHTSQERFSHILEIQTVQNAQRISTVVWTTLWWMDSKQKCHFKESNFKRCEIKKCVICTFWEGDAVSQIHICFNQWSSSRPDGGRCERIGSQRKPSLGRWTGTLLCSVGWSGYEDTLRKNEKTWRISFVQNIYAYKYHLKAYGLLIPNVFIIAFKC